MIDLAPHWPSASVNLALASNTTASGVLSVGDLWTVARVVMEAREPTPAAWTGAWAAIAAAWRERAVHAEGDWDRAMLHAGYAELFAERLMQDGDDREAMYLSGTRTVGASLAGLGFPCQRIELPAGDGRRLPALWAPGASSVAAVFLPGLDTTKEIWAALAATELSRIGVGVLFIDGPGQGESLRVAGIHFDHAAERTVATANSFLRQQKGVDPQKLLVIGASMGGYLAARAAARTTDLAGVVIWGAVWDYHALWVSRLEGQASPGGLAHLCRLTGADSARGAVDALSEMKMAGLAQDIRQPILILHGALDRQVPVTHAYSLFEAVSSTDKTLATFDLPGGGASHVQVDNLAVGLHRITSWIGDHFDLGSAQHRSASAPENLKQETNHGH